MPAARRPMPRLFPRLKGSRLKPLSSPTTLPVDELDPNNEEIREEAEEGGGVAMVDKEEEGIEGGLNKLVDG